MFGVSAYSAYWLYQNNNYQLTRVAQPAKDVKITKQEEEIKDVEYGPSVEITSPEQIEKARANTSQPLYLRSYLSIPQLGINLQVFEGTSDRVLTYGAGTIKANQNPDNFGNYSLAAHNFWDQSYGTGFSILQDVSNVDGMLAYLSDGDYIYTYRLSKRIQVHKDESMIYTEDVDGENFLQEEIKQYAPNDPQYKEETTEIDADGNPINQVKGKLLTLYTCYLEPTNRTIANDRIIVFGIQTNKQRLEDASDDVKQLFIDPSSQQLDVTKSEVVPEEAKNSVENSEKNTKDKLKADDLKLIEEAKNPIEEFIGKQIKKNPDFMMQLFWISFGLSAGILLIEIFSPIILNLIRR